MMTKKILLGLGLCSLLAFPAVNAQAEAGYCSNGVVTMVGAFEAGNAVTIRNTRTDCVGWANGAVRAFALDDSGGRANEMLAAAMAAQASGGNVLIISQSPTFANNSVLVLLYAQAELQP
jgi:hypothetical protein